jgi:hypothetical protein
MSDEPAGHSAMPPVPGAPPDPEPPAPLLGQASSHVVAQQFPVHLWIVV